MLFQRCSPFGTTLEIEKRQNSTLSIFSLEVISTIQKSHLGVSKIDLTESLNSFSGKEKNPDSSISCSTSWHHTKMLKNH